MSSQNIISMPKWYKILLTSVVLLQVFQSLFFYYEWQKCEENCINKKAPDDPAARLNKNYNTGRLLPSIHNTEASNLLGEISIQSSGIVSYTDEDIVLSARGKWFWASLTVGVIIIAAAASLAPVWAPVFVAGKFGK